MISTFKFVLFQIVQWMVKTIIGKFMYINFQHWSLLKNRIFFGHLKVNIYNPYWKFSNDTKIIEFRLLLTLNLKLYHKHLKHFRNPNSQSGNVIEGHRSASFYSHTCQILKMYFIFFGSSPTSFFLFSFFCPNLCHEPKARATTLP